MTEKTMPAEPTVSVIIGSNGAPGALESCLLALEGQRDGAEILVCEPEPSDPELQRRFPWACFVQRPGALVPLLWSEGIARSRGEIVALTISPMVPAADWLQTILNEHRDHDAVGGAIEPAPGIRLRDFAEYLCRYSREMLPFDGHRCLDLPGDNAAYKREWLHRVRQTYRDGFWEPDVHRELASQGATLWHSPAVVVRQARSAGARAFVRQRLAHGRAYGHQRGTRFGPLRNFAGVAGAPLVPALMLLRIFSELLPRRRHLARTLLALPYVLLFNTAWAVGEARGHLETLVGVEYPAASEGATT